jgi:membrane-anchored protein YejM (alkaline phosphatase superfamily)
VSPRRRLLRWVGWFAVVNAALLALVGLRYLWHYAALGRAVSWSYALVAYVGHLSALACIPLLLLLVPVVALLPRPRLVLPLGVIVGSAGVAFVLLDSLVFAENRYHLDVLTFTLLEPQTWAFLALYLLVALAIEAMLAGWVWQRTARPPTRRIGWSVGLALGACFVAGHLVHAWAEAHYDMSVTAFTRYLPLYHPLRNAGLLARLGLIDRMRARERGVGAALDRPAAGELNYPLASMRCEARRAQIQRVARRDRRHARRCLDARGRAAALRARARRDPVRPALQRRHRVAGRDVLAVLRDSRDVLRRDRGPCAPTGADGPDPTAGL